MKLDNKKIFFGITIMMIVIAIIVIVININLHSETPKKPATTSTPIPTESPSTIPSGEKPVPNPEITTPEDALQVIERLYHEPGYVFKIKTASEVEIIVEKVNSSTNQVDSEYHIDIKEQMIVNYKIEQSVITNEAENLGP